MRWLRNAAYLTAAAATSPIWSWRMHRTGKLRTDWAARFGRGEALPRTGRARILIYAVSVGEVNAIRQLVDRIVADASRPEVVIAAATDTGFARAREVFGARHAVVRYPFDASWMVERFLGRVQPDLVALCELEVWPNFVDACARRNIPVTVVNGRLSERSYGRYVMLKALFAPTFLKLDAVFAQNQEYAGRFLGLGAEEGRVYVTGTMKWDTAQIADSVAGADDFAEAMGIDRRVPLVVAGSTAPEEHRLLREAVPKGVQLLCAPRKPEWFDAAAADLPGCARRSQRTPGSASGLFLLDTIGELRKAYSLADVVVIGRTFGELHGSDPMEPAALGKAVMCGPRMGDFRESADALLAANAMVRVDRIQLAARLRALLSDDNERARMGRAAQEVVRIHQGATERTAEALLAILLQRQGSHA
jgi:3-deoxy-D-manno-octulosonic-acid transferase